MGFQEVELSPAMSLFKTGNYGFYLQNAFNRDWIDNTMVFLEVEDVQRFWDELLKLDLRCRNECCAAFLGCATLAMYLLSCMLKHGSCFSTINGTLHVLPP